MEVIKRNGEREAVSFDKVLNRITKSAERLHINPAIISQKVLVGIKDGIHTQELDELTMKIAISLCTTHPDYAELAVRIAVSNHQKNTKPRFCEVMRELGSQRHPKTGEPISYVSRDILDLCDKYEERIEAAMHWERDEKFDFFGFKTLEKQYLLKDATGRVLERPQHLWMRVALALWGSVDLDKAFATYDMMSMKMATHATPTLFNAGTSAQQLSSCFIAGTKVHTMNGVKKIEDINIGDEVVTHTGAIKKVIQTHTNLLGDRELFDIKVAGTPSFTVTGNHRLWSLSKEQDDWGQKPTWNPVNYLRIGDWIALPKKQGGIEYILDIKDILDEITTDGDNISYTYEYKDDKVYPISTYTSTRKNGPFKCSKQMLSFNRYWRFDNEMCELMGMWYGDGCVTNGKNSKGKPTPRNISIVSYNKNTTLIDFVKAKLVEKLGVPHITTSQDAHGMVQMVVNSSIIARVFMKVFGKGFGGKRLPSFFNLMTYEHIRYFLAGLVSTDGCVSSSGIITVSLTNPELMTDIYHLGRSVNIPVTLTFMSSNNKKATGRMSVPSNILVNMVKKHYIDDRLTLCRSDSSWNCIKIIDDTVFMRLNNKSHAAERPEHVYTFGVEDDHSYSVNGIIAENCFLLAMHDDSIKGIYKTLTDCALISKNAGGIGLHIHNVRAQGSLIRGTNGVSNGIVPMLRNFNSTARYVDQGGQKRNGSFAIYLEPWHADIEEFLKLKLNQGAEEERARDLFYGLWVSDLFMKRVEADGEWTLFCPNEAPGLADVVGEEFEALYTRYEKEGRGRRTVQAQKLWFRILDTQIETGTPYLLYKDAANLKSNQQNLGVIKSSNLCCEILEYSSPEETAVCNLASLALPAFVNQQKKTFNFAMLRRTVRQLTQNLNRVIDINYYPTPETRTSNMRHRPIGIGVQGLADVFAMMRMPWEGELAADLNQRIFEHIYYAALDASADMAQGAADSPAEGPYETFAGSPMAAGKLQPDFWNVTPLTERDESLDWTALRAKAVKGIRNSLLVAPMPTASTSQILGYTECFEPISSNIYTRRTLAGEFIVVNKYLLKDLMAAGIWSEDMKQKIIVNNGSIQGIEEIPENIQELYKTSYEVKQRTLIDMAAARGAFICQSQSLNLFIADPTYAKLSAMHFYSWKKGLKTGIYYLRSKAPVMAQKFTVDPDLVAAVTGASISNGLGYTQSVTASQGAAPADEGCLLCSS